MFHILRGLILSVLILLAGIAAAQDLRAPPLLQLNDATALPIKLVSLNAKALVVGRVAHTDVTLTFHNPNGRILEGALQFPLLEGQQVTAFALDINGELRSAVPVEKAKGQAVFEDVTRARVDPALLETTRGNNFKLRLYPIPANGERRVRLTVSERLPERRGEALYRLPLPAAERPKEFHFMLTAPGRAGKELRVLRGLSEVSVNSGGVEAVARNAHLDVPVEIALAEPQGSPALTEERHGRHYFYAEPLPLAFAHSPRSKPARVALVWDASGSGASRDHGREFGLLDAWFKAVGNTEVQLTLARDRAEDKGHYIVRNGDWSALRAMLEAVDYDGGTAFAAFKPAKDVDAILLFTDGLGNYDEPAMPQFDKPVFVVNAAASADTLRLRHAAARSGGAFADLTSSDTADALRILREAAPRLISVRSNGATDLVTSFVDNGRVAVAGVLAEATATIELEWHTPDGTTRRQTLHISGGKTGEFAAAEWARLKLAGLEAEPELHRAEIVRLGKEFGLLSRGTSLIVLDRVEDYVRYDIEPPAAMRDEFEHLRGQARLAVRKDKAAHLEQIVARFLEKQQWWDKDFPKDTPAKPQVAEANVAAVASVESRRQAPHMMEVARPMAALSAPAPLAQMAAGAAREKSTAKAEAGPAMATIQLKKWTPDAPYAERLRQAAAKDLYRVYLDERPGNLQSTAFFLDVADIFLDRGQPELALRILSNLAEMDLENRHILRILGYRLLQAKQAILAVPVLEKVLELAPDEPQSWRDLGLAYAEAGQRQKAVDKLWQVVERPWHDRFPDVELIALAEMNALIATSPEKLDTSAMDPRLLCNLPLDLRAVLSWDADNTDIDLWVTDPNGEKAYYAHRLTYQGGAMSRDFTGGYGPEEFSLKTAQPGKYLVQAQFFGHRQQVVSGATTLQLRLTTGFGTARQQDQSVTLRLKSGGETVTVGEFVVGGK